MAKTYRSWNVPLTEATQNTESIRQLLEFLTIELNKQLPNAIKIEFDNINSNGLFRLEYESKLGRPNREWSIPGNKAKYQRMIVERIRGSISSLRERAQVSQVCEKFDYDITRKNEIRGELCGIGLYPTDGVLRNICRAKALPGLTDKVPAYLDYTTGDKQIFRREWLSENEFIDSIEVLGEWIDLKVRVPAHLHSWVKIAKPVLLFSGDSIMIRYAYEVETQSNSSNVELRLGVDLGKIHPFVASVTGADGSWSGALMPSRETANLQKTIDRVLLDLDAKYARRERLEGFLEHREDAVIRASWEAVNEDIQLQRTILSRRKAHLARLVARDVVNHAVEIGATTIHLEDLRWLDSQGGKWNHAEMQRCIREAAELRGITVFIVNAKNSSHTDPFTEAHIDPRADRTVETSVGVLDRDHCASLEVGVRVPHRAKKTQKRRVLTPKKGIPTSRRPKTVTRKKAWKVAARITVELAGSASDFITLSKQSDKINIQHTKLNYSEVLRC